jgi:hypothetical protein
MFSTVTTELFLRARQPGPRGRAESSHVENRSDFIFGWFWSSFFLGPATKKKFFKNYFKKICDFSQIFLLHFNQYQFVFLYCKDTNLVL